MSTLFELAKHISRTAADGYADADTYAGLVMNEVQEICGPLPFETARAMRDLVKRIYLAGRLEGIQLSARIDRQVEEMGL